MFWNFWVGVRDGSTVLPLDRSHGLHTGTRETRGHPPIGDISHSDTEDRESGHQQQIVARLPVTFRFFVLLGFRTVSPGRGPPRGRVPTLTACLVMALNLLVGRGLN